MQLQLAGHEAEVAYDGPEAIDKAATFRPAMILLDIGLPRMNGYEVCRRLREQPWGRGIRIVALTGWGQGEDRQRSRAAGFDAHLVKPADRAVLLELLSTLPRPLEDRRPEV